MNGDADAGLERAAGTLLGRDPAAPVRLEASRESPLEALEGLLREALTRPPCVVAFSGGRDSSALLAVAADVARREGLEPPIPLTQLFRAFPDSHEGEWQQLVLEHLGLTAEVHEVHGELDLLGPVARAVLHEHGPVTPPWIYMQRPLLEAASGGWLVTGYGGDDVFGEWRWTRQARILGGLARLSAADVPALANAALPRPLRARVAGMRGVRAASSRPWLLPEAYRAFERQRAADEASEPITWPRRLAWWVRGREVTTYLERYGALAAASGTAALHPFATRRFLAAMAGAGGRWGPGSRTEVMRAMFGRLLPDAVNARSTKADFTRAVFGEDSRAFARRWDGGGVDRRLVDPDVLRAEWARPMPDARTAGLLHDAWLASVDRREEQVRRGRERA